MILSSKSVIPVGTYTWSGVSRYNDKNWSAVFKIFSGVYLEAFHHALLNSACALSCRNSLASLYLSCGTRYTLLGNNLATRSAKALPVSSLSTDNTIFWKLSSHSLQFSHSFLDGAPDGNDTTGLMYWLFIICATDKASSSPSVMVTVLEQPAVNIFIPNSSSPLNPSLV